MSVSSTAKSYLLSGVKVHPVQLKNVKNCLSRCVCSTARLLSFSLQLSFPSSSSVRWPYLSWISYQAEKKEMLTQTFCLIGGRRSQFPAVRHSPSCLYFVLDCHLQRMFFPNPPLCFASFPRQYFPPLSEFFCCPPLCSLLLAWSVPVVRVSSPRGDIWGLIWLFLWSHEWFRPPWGKKQRVHQSATAQSLQRNYHYSFSVNPPRSTWKRSFCY